MISGSISIRYARAMFEISSENGTIASDYETLKALAEALESEPEDLVFLSNGAIDKEARIQAIGKAAEGIGASPDMVRFLKLLVEKKRIVHLPGVLGAYESMRNESENRIQVEVRTAGGLSESERTKLMKGLAGRLGKTVELSESADPGLLGGVWIRVDSMVLDGTLRSQLDRLKAALTQSR